MKDQTYFKLTPVQQGLWFNYRSDPLSVIDNICLLLDIQGELDAESAALAWHHMADELTVSRMRFAESATDIRMAIDDRAKIDWKYLETPSSVKEAMSTAARIANAPFDLENVALLRGALIKINDHRHLFLIAMPHIVSDQPSLVNIAKRFLSKYKKDKSDNYKNELRRYQHYLEDQAQRNRSDSQDYWLNRFQESFAEIRLEGTGGRSECKDNSGAILQMEWSESDSQKWNLCMEKFSNTDYIQGLALLYAFLYKRSGTRDLIVGTPVSERRDDEYNSMIGCLLNVVPLRFQIDPDADFADVLTAVKKMTWEAWPHANYPFFDLVRALNPDRQAGRHPLFDIFFQNFREDHFANSHEWTINRLNLDEFETGFDLRFIVRRNGAKISWEVKYRRALYDHDMVRAMLNQIRELFLSIWKEPHLPLNNFSLATDQDILAYSRLNAGRKTFERATDTIGYLLARRAGETPESIAAVFRGQEFTYAQLDQDSNRLARTLRRLGLERNMVAGMLIGRNYKLLVVIWAIIKAGGAYLPLDPVYPRERLEFMLKNSKARLLVVDNEHQNLLDFSHDAVNIDNPESWDGDMNELILINEPNDLLYVIYTSGSTGLPKGVMVEHASVNNLIWAINHRFNLYKESAIIFK